MAQFVPLKKKFVKLTACIIVFAFIIGNSFAQPVENRGCPNSYFRNNGNGQAVTVFASNISPSGIYYQSALNSGNQGNFTFKWGTNIINPPVINKTWITSASGVTSLNWVFGNNSTGTPFNPPGVPLGTDVKYTFYNNNLPTAGSITLEFIDPFDGSFVNTCSYPLLSGASSSGNLTSLAVAPPSAFSYAVSAATTAYGTAGNSVAPTINSGGGTITYQLETTVSGVSIDQATGIISWNNTVQIGTYNLTIRASNGLQPDATTSYTLTVTESGVSSGGGGGLESKSLGNAVAERVFNNSVQSVPAEINYPALPELSNQSTARLSSLSIRDFMPDHHLLGNGFTGYITSPTDILSFTNAKDVVSVDYVEAGLNKAVAFCTKTYGGIYTHTKPVCDRLKGSELLSVDTIVNGQYKFLRYHLKPATGLNEYAVSFSAGFNQQTQQYILQSEWTTDRYAAQDTMYNFQLWSADATLLKTMLNNVLQKLNNDMAVSQAGPVKIPVTYITKAERDAQNQLNLQLTIKNNTAHTSATIMIAGKSNEQSNIVINRSYPVSLTANAISTITIPVKEMAEAEIRLMVNGSNEDFVYSNDGMWNLYKTAASQVSEFTISNDTLQPRATEYRLFRNVKLKGTTQDYITVYRMVKGGGMAADLSQYNYLKFSATGTGSVRIRLIKKSISNYNEQYEYVLPLQSIEKEYNIRISDFKSTATTALIKMNDIVITSFTYESTGSSPTINTSLSNVRFAKFTNDIIAEAGKLKIFPNPAKAQVYLNFESATAETMNLQLINTANGQTVMQKSINVIKGNNYISIALPGNIADGMYILKMRSATQKFQTKILKTK